MTFLAMDRLSIISAAFCSIALASAPSAAQTDRFSSSTADQPRLIKVAQPVGAGTMDRRQNTAHISGFRRAAHAMQRVRLVRELDTLKQRMMVEGLLARLDMETEKRLAELDGVAWRFERILDGFERGDTDLGLNGRGDADLQRDIRRTRAAWNAFVTVILDVQGAGKVDDEHVKGLSSAEAWLDLEVTDLVKRVDEGARKDGATPTTTVRDAAIARRSKMLRQMLAGMLTADISAATAETR